jgi:tetratricopeptide (TPR) repeat protein
MAPNSAEAWGKLAIAYQISRNVLPPPEADAARERARSAAARALAIEPDNPTGLTAQALDLPMLGRWLDVEQACRRILTLEPDHYDALGLLAHVLAQVGRTNETLATLRRIGPDVEMVPLLAFRHAVLLWSAGRIEESDRLIDRAMALSPRNYVIWFSRFWLYARTGRGREALALSANRAMRPAGIPDENFELNDLSARALLTRTPDHVAAALKANREAAPKGSGFAENAIMVAAQLGALDQAFEVADAYYLDRGFRVGPGRFTAQQGVYTDPGRRLTAFLWTPSCREMRADPRFMPLMGEIGLASYWRRTGTRPDAMTI